MLWFNVCKFRNLGCDPVRAIIVGAGIAGLSAALRLGQAGWETLIVERAPRRRGGGYLVAFGGIGLTGAERMGVLDQLRAHAHQPSEMTYYDVAGNRRFAVGGDVIAATLGTTFNILRRDIESVLFRAVRDRTEIRFGTTVSAITQDDQGVHAVLSDGTHAEADLLIGADGLHSSVRSMMFGPEQDYAHDLKHKVAVYMLPERPSGLGEHAGAASMATAGCSP
ncbi:MAG TPA: FAD-dependent monooxygenase [Microlunatus sp.]|nr:FAD-dependent monooxygenase [Microlunatus sp.]